jgi:hypothetical protein
MASGRKGKSALSQGLGNLKPNFSIRSEGMYDQPITERWKSLCEQAVSEQDGVRLLEIINELNRVLDDGAHKAPKQARSATGA